VILISVYIQENVVSCELKCVVLSTFMCCCDREFLNFIVVILNGDLSAYNFCGTYLNTFVVGIAMLIVFSSHLSLGLCVLW